MRTIRTGTIIRGVALASLGALLASCREGVLEPHGPIGNAELVILYDATAIMLAVVIPVILLTIGFAWWFRAGNTRARYLPDWEYSGRIEMIVWSIPALVIVFLGGIAWIGSHDLDPPRPIESAAAPLEVEVVSLDWKWLFIYPDEGIASVNRLVVPVGTPVRFRLTSASVMNSFFVPQLGSQIYTMPGMTTRLNLQADQPGRLPGSFGAIQRRRLLRHALRRGRAFPRTNSRLGSRPRRRKDGRSTRPPTTRSHIRARRSRPRPSPRRARPVRNHLGRSGERRSPVASGALTCWASSPGRRSRSTSRSS